jgi:lipoate-protein ligase A
LPYKQYVNEGLKEYYSIKHSRKDFQLLEQAVKELYPEYSNSFDIVMNGHKFYGYNMFISKKKIFSEYMKWLFTILSYVEKRIVISDDPYQARVFGFMAERLFTLYVYHNNLRVYELPIVYLDENVKKLTWQRKSGHTMLANIGVIKWL